MRVEHSNDLPATCLSVPVCSKMFARVHGVDTCRRCDVARCVTALHQPRSRMARNEPTCLVGQAGNAVSKYLLVHIGR
jgi:hypothetical protein